MGPASGSMTLEREAQTPEAKQVRVRIARGMRERGAARPHGWRVLSVRDPTASYYGASPLPTRREPEGGSLCVPSVTPFSCSPIHDHGRRRTDAVPAMGTIARRRRWLLARRSVLFLPFTTTIADRGRADLVIDKASPRNNGDGYSRPRRRRPTDDEPGQ